MSAAMMPQRPVGRRAPHRLRERYESMLVVMLSIGCLVLALIDLVLLATYSV